jgi:hypothetical protein
MPVFFFTSSQSYFHVKQVAELDLGHVVANVFVVGEICSVDVGWARGNLGVGLLTSVVCRQSNLAQGRKIMNTGSGARRVCVCVCVCV